MNAPVLKPYRVHLHRRGGKTKGRLDVQAQSAKHAERVAVEQTIAVSFPDSKRSNWIVTQVEAL